MSIVLEYRFQRELHKAHWQIHGAFRGWQDRDTGIRKFNRTISYQKAMNNRLGLYYRVKPSVIGRDSEANLS